MRYGLAEPYLTKNGRKYVMKALADNWISSKGKNVSRFEYNFARYIGGKFAVATSSGTSALHLALLALGIKRGDEVIVPDLTFAATINAVIYTGATPVVVDIEKADWCISVEKIEKAITPRTKAIIPVHLYGQPCDMKALMKVASKYGIKVVEDCAEALGAEFNGKKVGNWGAIGCFSFFANKTITTGEGGMCVTDDRRLAEKLKILRDHGMNPNKKYWHDCVGYNYRMTNLQASLGLAQLEKVDEIIGKRNRIEDYYVKGLKDLPFLVPQRGDLEKRKKVTWLVSFLNTSNSISRDSLIKRLDRAGIETRPFFYPITEQPIYSKYKRGSIGESYDISRTGISFPTNLHLSALEYQEIISVIKDIFRRNAG